jgi:hypothetical protein
MNSSLIQAFCEAAVGEDALAERCDSEEHGDAAPGADRAQADDVIGIQSLIGTTTPNALA